MERHPGMRRRVHVSGIRLAGVVAAVSAIAAVAAASPAYADTMAVVSTQAVGDSSGLRAVGLLSATNGWGVGSAAQNGLIERFNGSAFTAVPSVDLLDRSNPNNFAALAGGRGDVGDQRHRRWRIDQLRPNQQHEAGRGALERLIVGQHQRAEPQPGDLPHRSVGDVGD
jgi:hypothetical protein